MYGAPLPSVHFSESGVGIRSYFASDPLLVFVAVKQMGPSSREAIGPEVPYSQVSFVSANVPRMRLCFIVCCKKFTYQ